MRLPELPFTRLDWSALSAEEHLGAEGTSHWRTFEAGGLRVRLVDYGEGFVADHWCDRGHVFLVISGDITLRLKDGREFPLAEGDGFCVSDHGDAPHLVVSQNGCRAFIVD